MKHWNKTNETLPEENKVVRTLSESGIEQDLKRKGKLWFYPDGSMYVYYVPKFWLEKD